MIVTLSSVGGSPGVTSWALLLAAAWPSEFQVERAVLEADLDGGVLGARYAVGVEPGAAALVSGARRAESGPVDLSTCGRRIADDVWLVPGSESAEQARPVWSSRGAAESVANALANDNRTWFVDAGRAGPTSVLAPLFERSTMSLLFTRSEHEALVQVPARVEGLKRVSSMSGVVVVGKPAFSPGELQQFFASHKLWVVEEDRHVVDSSRDVWSQRRARRSMLWRSAVTVAADVGDVTVYRTGSRAPGEEVSDAG
jgi:hypothetical protein